MKCLGAVTVLKHPDSVVPLDDFFAKVLGLGEQTVLYAVGIPPAPAASADGGWQSEDRLLSLMLTPFPKPCWSRLLRLSATIEPRPGSLRRLLNGLKRLSLFPRHIEDVTGTELPPAGGWQTAATGASTHQRGALPSVTVTLELPQRPLSAEGSTASHDTVRLHEMLVGLIESAVRDDTHSPAFPAIKLLQTALVDEGSTGTTIQWISPMATLNKLAADATLRPEKVQVVKLHAGPPLVLGVTLEPWARDLWRGEVVAPHEPARKSLLALPSVDSDERVLGYYFLRYVDRLVVQFSLMTPSLGLEHLWWDYVCQCVADAGGSILGSRSTARTEGFWTTLETTAAFPLATDEHDATGRGDPARAKAIVNCFRRLQGDRSYTTEFDRFTKSLRDEKESLRQALFGDDGAQASADWIASWERAEALTKSQLERLVVWDPVQSPGPRYPGLFAPNPFAFTFPMTHGGYTKFYGDGNDAAEKRTRLRTARRIVEKLENGENIAIVGAHRTGKSTLLNLIRGELLQRRRSRRTPYLIPVPLNASVTPPHLLLFSILQEVAKLTDMQEEADASAAAAGEADAKANRVRRRPPRGDVGVFGDGMLTALGSGVKTAFRKLSISVGPVEFDVAEIRRAVKDAMDERSPRIDRSLYRLRGGFAGGAEGAISEFLRLSLIALRDGIGRLGRGRPVRLVLLVDEFSESLAWGDPRTLAVWRHVIESKEFDGLKWVFTTSQSVREASEDYSPLTNSLVEVNVGALEQEESHAVIDAFSVAAWRKRKKDKHLWPVITHPARQSLIRVTSGLPYLLQVCCYHIYERAVRSAFPLINKELCRKTILTKVLPEIADYLETQWQRVPAVARGLIEESLKGFMKAATHAPAPGGSHADLYLRQTEVWPLAPESLPPGSLKELERAGLRAEGEGCIAPLVGAWLLSRDIP